jgi:hypothetical protein
MKDMKYKLVPQQALETQIGRVEDAFDENRWNECSHGIHFFITRKEAEDYDSPLTQEEAEDYDDD